MISVLFLLSALVGAITALPLCQFSGYCRTAADCVAGNQCIEQNFYYSQCLADPTTYSTVVGCLQNFGGKCAATTDCCDPGAYCDTTMDPQFPQCKQPTATTGK